MFRFLKHIFVATCILAIANLVMSPIVMATVSYQDVCDISFEYREECVEFIFSDTCVPWNTTNCQIKHMTFSEHHCWIYDCSVSLHDSIAKLGKILRISIRIKIFRLVNLKFNEFI